VADRQIDESEPAGHEREHRLEAHALGDGAHDQGRRDIPSATI
jgi:hypothetical protein